MRVWDRKSLWVVLASLAMLCGCASAPEKKLDSKIAEEPPIQNRQALQAQNTQLIASAPGLSDDQKAKLNSLRDSIRAKTDALSEEALKLRSLLIKDLLMTKYDSREVELIEKKLRKVENDRVSAMVDGVKKANVILGHQVDPTHEPLMREILTEPHGGRYD